MYTKGCKVTHRNEWGIKKDDNRRLYYHLVTKEYEKRRKNLDRNRRRIEARIPKNYFANQNSVVE